MFGSRFLPVSLCLLLVSFSPSTALALSSEQEDVLARIDSLWFEGQAAAAHASIESLLPPARAASDSTFLFRLLMRHGQMYAALGDGQSGEPHLREALVLAEALADTLYMCVTLRWLGAAIGAQGRHAEAKSCNDRLLAWSMLTGNREHEAWALTGQAYSEWLSGEVSRARDLYREAADIFQEEAMPRAELFVLNGLGNALQGLGEAEEARECYLRTAEIGAEIGYIFAEALAENNLGTMEFSLGDPGRAMEHFRRSHELHREDGSLGQGIIPAMNVALCETYLGRHRQAIAHLEDLLWECKQGGLRSRELDVMTQIATVRRDQGRPRQAVRIFREVLGSGADLSPEQVIEALVGLSSALADQDSARAALTLLHRREEWAKGLETPMLRSVFRIELGLRYLNAGEDRAALEELSIADRETKSWDLGDVRLRALGPAAQAARALGEPETARRILRDAVALWETERGLPLDPEWRELRGAAARQIYTELAANLLEHPESAPQNERVRAAYDALQVFKARTLLERMLGPGRRSREIEIRPATLAQLQEGMLREDELLLDFFLGPRISFLFAVSRAECRALPLPGEEALVSRLQLFHELLSSRVGASREELEEEDRDFLQRSGETLGDLLLGGVTDMIARSRSVLFAPDGALNLLPLRQVLPARAAAGAAALPAAPLDLQRVPSATLLVQIRDEERHETSGGRGVLAVRGTLSAAGEPLEGAGRELRHLRRRFRDVSQDLASAGGDSLREELASYELLHFAAHSSVDDQSPWRSVIHLNPEGSGDGGLRLRASQITGMDLRARLAVLSSCESAGGRILSGEGVQGLGSAFLSAGVPAVLASLWPVDDAATTRLMKHFYDALARGETAAAALRTAQRELRSDPRSEHPFFWAGFVLLGDGRIRPELAPRDLSYLFWGLGVLLVVSGALGLGRILARRHPEEAL